MHNPRRVLSNIVCIILFLAGLIAWLILISGCTGEQGPPGPQGPPGNTDTLVIFHRDTITTTIYDSTHTIIETIMKDTLYDIVFGIDTTDYAILTPNNPITLSWNRVEYDTLCNEEYVTYIPGATIIIPDWKWDHVTDTTITFDASGFVDGSLILFRVFAVDQAGNISKAAQWNRIYIVEKGE